MAKKLLRIIGQFISKFFAPENIDALIDQLIDALYDRYSNRYVRGDDNTNV